MPATIVRSPQHRGLVLLESSVNTEPDGFIQVRARFLAPENNNADAFVIDAPWPLAELPRNLPPNQGGPYLNAWQTKFENGLVYIDATFVTAIAPARINVQKSVDRRSFSAADEFVFGVVIEGDTARSGVLRESLSFDYSTTSITHQYATIDPNREYRPPFNSSLGSPFNLRRIVAFEGQENRDKIGPGRMNPTRNVFLSGSSQRVGRVLRVSITATPIYEYIRGARGGGFGLGTSQDLVR